MRGFRSRLKLAEQRNVTSRGDPLEKTELYYDSSDPGFDMEQLQADHMARFPMTKTLFCYPKRDPNEPE